jgi:hypothetical protein
MLYFNRACDHISEKTSVLYKHVVDLYIARLQALRLSAARAPNPPLKRRQRSQYHRCSAGGQQTMTSHKETPTGFLLPTEVDSELFQSLYMSATSA